ncbi:MAG: peptide deformylase [Aureliella sp.]
MFELDFSPEKLQVITYPHPALRYVAKPIKRVDASLKQIAQRMIDLMYEHSGVGLAATQVNLPLRLFVWDPSGKRESGKASVFLNPTITRPRSNEEAEEGCLSLPGVHANVVRAKTIHMHAYDIQGREIDADFTGYEARILQHETDHLNGVLFIDRLSPERLREHHSALYTFETDFDSRQRLGSIPPANVLQEQLAAWERKYA